MKSYYLHYLIPFTVARCPSCDNGYLILTPLAENHNKYTLKLRCGHTPTAAVRTAAKAYYRRLKQEARQHRRTCMKILEGNK